MSHKGKIQLMFLIAAPMVRRPLSPLAIEQ